MNRNLQNLNAKLHITENTNQHPKNQNQNESFPSKISRHASHEYS